MRNWSENKIRLALIRHGATKANKEHRYLGKTDEDLSEEGIDELRRMRGMNRYPDVDYLFSSPMKRCLETAGILYPEKEAIVIPEWKEMDFGVFEGKNYIELQSDVRYQTWIGSDGTLPFPEGESREEFNDRCGQGFYRMLQKLSKLAVRKPGGTITIGLVVHGGTIMSLLSRYSGGGYFDYQAANGRGYLCTLEGSIKNPEIGIIETIRGE